MNRQQHSPSIRVYYCRNSSHAAELPGALTALHATGEIALEAVPCSGRIDPRYIMKAFESGTQAVCILACQGGHCKLIEGNLRTSRRVQAVRAFLSEVGLDPEAVQVFVPTDPAQDTLDAAVATVSRAAMTIHAQPQGVTV